MGDSRCNKGAEILYFCPFQEGCVILFREEDIYNHFEIYHRGVITLYFDPKFSFTQTSQSSMYMIRFDKKYFVLNVQRGINRGECKYWMWIVGTENDAARYNLSLKFITGNGVEFNLQTSVYSLKRVPPLDVRRSKKPISIKNSSSTGVYVEIIKN